MLAWVPFLHIYQPPGQDPEIVRQVARESYRLILDLCERYPRFRASINISGSLLEQWEADPECAPLIAGYRACVERGQLRLVGSAMYHPILALLPEHERERQIDLHDRICRRLFGDAYQPYGFFAPEMAYDRALAELLERRGFQWIMLDEAHLGRVPDATKAYRIRGTSLYAVVRNRTISKTFPPEYIVDHLHTTLKDTPYVITAHDGELFGHWHKDDQGYYARAFESPDIRFLTVHEYLGELTEVVEVEPEQTNWEAVTHDLARGVRFALWSHPDNEIHRRLWQLADCAITTLAEYPDDPGYAAARAHLDRGLASCSWWWGSDLKLDVVANEVWSPDMVERGVKELIASIRSLATLPGEKKIEAEKMRTDLLFALWKKHWSKEREK
ncbi:MAG TPA: hypothetical protein VG753_02410 [Candidatus Paceibacterota bacterium]|nr:hypothetical protein [Candidatus Paceibacterota bacterium]